MEKQLDIVFFFVRDTFSVLHESFILIFSSVLPFVIKSHCIQNGTTHAFQVRKIESGGLHNFSLNSVILLFISFNFISMLIF